MLLRADAGGGSDDGGGAAEAGSEDEVEVEGGGSRILSRPGNRGGEDQKGHLCIPNSIRRRLHILIEGYRLNFCRNLIIMFRQLKLLARNLDNPTVFSTSFNIK